MKEVYSSRLELCHVWANLTDKERKESRYGRTGDSYMSFVGPALYSYKTVIARYVSGKGGRLAVIFDQCSFSSSTGKHQSHARRAIANDVPIFYVNAGVMGQDLRLDGRGLVRHYVDRAKKFVIKSEAPRIRQTTRDALKASALDQIREANRAKEFFGIRGKPIPEDIAGIARASKKEIARIERERKRAEKIRKEREEAYKREVSAFTARYADLWRKGGELTQSQKDEEKNRFAKCGGASLYQWPLLLCPPVTPDGFRGNVLLRLSPDQTRVETSQGAQVLVRTVSFLWAFCAHARQTRTAVARETVARFPRLDYYQAESVDGFGNVVAGCHRIPFEEIRLIAEALNLPPPLSDAGKVAPVLPENLPETV